MNYMYSVNANNGQTQITVDFDVKTDPNIDQVLTQLRTSQAQSQLPAQVNTAGLLIRKSPIGAADAGGAVFAATAPTTTCFSPTTPTSTWSTN